MALNRWIYVVTVVMHVLLVALVFVKLALQESLRHQLFERYHGMLIGGGADSKNALWAIALRLFQLFGMQTAILHAAAILLSRRLFADPYSRHLNGMSHLWSTLTIQYLLLNLLLMCLFIRFVEYTNNAVAETLEGGLEMFQFDTTWNTYWNDLQTDYGCCGVRNYTDWNEMVWPTAEQEAQFMRFLTDNAALVPISCCRKEMLQRDDCIGERINLGATELLRCTDDPHSFDAIYHAACLDAVQNALSSSTRAVCILDAILCSTQFATLFLMRLLFIINRNFQSHTLL